MPKSIGQRGIVSRRSIGLRQIAGRGSYLGAVAPQVYPYRSSSYTFTAQASGYYEVAAWGPGYNSTSAATGAFALKRVRLAVGQSLTVSVGAAGFFHTGSGGGSGGQTSTTVTFPDGSTLTAGAANGGVGGTASGGDVNINGSSGAGNGTTYGNYRGGDAPADPGSGSTANGSGGNGMVIIAYLGS